MAHEGIVLYLDKNSLSKDEFDYIKEHNTELVNKIYDIDILDQMRSYGSYVDYVDFDSNIDIKEFLQNTGETTDIEEISKEQDLYSAVLKNPLEESFKRFKKMVDELTFEDFSKNINYKLRDITSPTVGTVFIELDLDKDNDRYGVNDLNIDVDNAYRSQFDKPMLIVKIADYHW